MDELYRISRDLSTGKLAHVVDLFLHSGDEYTQQATELLHLLRTREDVLLLRNPIRNAVYDDSQNVHNSNINKNVLKIIETLAEDRYGNKILLDDPVRILEIIRNKFAKNPNRLCIFHNEFGMESVS